MWWLRRTFGAAAILTLLLAVIAGGIFGMAQTRLGRDWIAGAISDAASTPGSRVTIAGIEGVVPFAMTIRELAVSDDAGPWLAVVLRRHGRHHAAVSPLRVARRTAPG